MGQEAFVWQGAPGAALGGRCRIRFKYLNRLIKGLMMRLIKELQQRYCDLRITDLYAVLQFIIAYPISKLYKFYRRDLWLICEDPYEARDNGYAFFKFLVTSRKGQDAVYAIKRKSPDYPKVSSLGKTVEYGSLLHWIYYLTAARNISSQKGGKPNAAICYLLEIFLNQQNNRVFLQHGITKDDAKWLYYKNTKLNLFICGAKPEYDYIKKKFGYPGDNLKYIGFCRYDELHNIDIKKNQVLIMPTWRNWLSMPSKKRQFINQEQSLDTDNLFLSSEYYLKWKELLTSPELRALSLKYNAEIIFFPHRNMQKYLQWFQDGSPHIKIANWEKFDIQKLIRESGILITDYSSVFFDFIYMKKPIIFYQFDEIQYRKYQYQQGYFDYNNNPFSIPAHTYQEALNTLTDILEKDSKLDIPYLTAHEKYFKLYDANNCARTYQAIKNMNL